MNISLKNSNDEAIRILRRLSANLERASIGKLSTNDISTNRLWWEICNKLFTILVSCENSIITKDSLSCHLIARYTYEMYVTVGYIFFDVLKTPELVEKFIKFNQFKTSERKWINKTFSQMVDDMPSDKKILFHNDHYRSLSNYAHPTMDSFLLNRRGDEAEFLMILNTVLLTLVTVVEIIRVCIKNTDYFNNDQVASIAIDNICEDINALRAIIKV